MSKVIKASHVISVDDKVVIHPNKSLSPQGEADSQEIMEVEQNEPLSEAQTLKDRIISDAEAAADNIVAQAAREVEQLKNKAKAEIDAWWVEKRQADTDQAERAKQKGHDKGYQEGYAKAEEAVQEQYAQMIGNAKSIIEHASVLKQQMIQEAEPFLLELSCSIAEKVISRQLALEPEWIVDSIRKVLQRKREQGTISLCVSPSQFPFILDAREELSLSIDSQAELQVLPDPSVHDYGCVVRSSFGSIDARIDTQLEEIKDALLQLFRRSEGNPHDE